MNFIKIICQISFGIMLIINCMFIIANLLTVSKLSKYGMGSWSGYIITDYILFILLPSIILLLISSILTLFIKRLFWSVYKREYKLLFLISISFIVEGLSFYICSNCRY